MNFGKMMKEPSNKVFGLVLLFGVVVLVVILMKYNQTKNTSHEKLTLQSGSGPYTLEASANMVPSGAAESHNFLDVTGIQSSTSGPSGSPNSLNPSDLLPRDVNSEWSNVNPASNDLKNLNLLSSDQMIGINTVSGSLRNANLQIRSEPVIEKKDIGPWGNSTIQPDTYRRPLEIGSRE